MSGSEGLETEVTSRGLSSRLPSLLLSTCREKHHKTIRPKGPAPLAQWPRGLFSLSGSFLVLSLRDFQFYKTANNNNSDRELC